VVLVADECRLEKESGTKSVWYPKGEKTSIKVDQEKEAISFYGALNVRTGDCHVLDTPWQNALYTVRFLRKVERIYRGRKVLLIWDGASHHKGEVRDYLKEKNKKWWLELLNFPPYSPDLNPQEQVWKEGRRHITHNSEDDFEEKALKFYQFLVGTKFKTNFLEKHTLF
jgi:transposase